MPHYIGIHVVSEYYPAYYAQMVGVRTTYSSRFKVQHLQGMCIAMGKFFLLGVFKSLCSLGHQDREIMMTLIFSTIDCSVLQWPAVNLKLELQRSTCYCFLGQSGGGGWGGGLPS